MVSATHGVSSDFKIDAQREAAGPRYSHEIVSGAVTDRKELGRALKALAENGTLPVTGLNDWHQLVGAGDLFWA
jgi:hypothetical protein